MRAACAPAGTSSERPPVAYCRVKEVIQQLGPGARKAGERVKDAENNVAHSHVEMIAIGKPGWHGRKEGGREMKKLMALVLAVAVLSPAVAFAGSSTDAALGLGAFAVFNQILGGTGVFQPYPPQPQVIVVQPPVPYYPDYYDPTPGYYAPTRVIIIHTHHHRHHDDDDDD